MTFAPVPPESFAISKLLQPEGEVIPEEEEACPAEAQASLEVEEVVVCSSSSMMAAVSRKAFGKTLDDAEVN